MYLACSLEPDVVFPMEEINGVTLVGAIDGEVQNGATLVAGRYGNALYTNGSGTQYVTYGHQPTLCYTMPSVCTTSGLTYSMWVRIHQEDVISVIFASGAFRGYAGIYLVYKDDNYWQAGVKTPTMKYKYRANPGTASAGHWLHMVVTWSVDSYMQMYINGCEAGGTPTLSAESPLGGIRPFNIGADGNTENRAHMELDHLLIWTQAMTPVDIWHLYMQGGTI